MRKGKPESKLRWSDSRPMVLAIMLPLSLLLAVFFFIVFINTILVVIISYSLSRTYDVPSMLHTLPVTLNNLARR